MTEIVIANIPGGGRATLRPAAGGGWIGSAFRAVEHSPFTTGAWL